MDPLTAGIVLEVLRGVRAGMAWFVSKRGGNNAGAMAAIRQWGASRDKSLFGDDINDALGLASSGLAFLTARGMIVDEVMALLDRAAAEDRDVSDDEVLSFFRDTQAIADRVEDKLADLENEEAGGETSSETGADTVDDNSPGADTSDSDDDNPDPENPPA